jgi:hypothetical protein
MANMWQPEAQAEGGPTKLAEAEGREVVPMPMKEKEETDASWRREIMLEN